MKAAPCLALFCCCSMTLSACAQGPAPSPPPERPFSARPGGTGSSAALEQQLAAMRDIQQKMLHARTGAERQALAPAHSRAMREALAALQASQGTAARGMGHGGGMAMPGPMMHQHMAVMHLLMEMLVLRVEQLSEAGR